jgi:hypothetical protein
MSKKPTAKPNRVQIAIKLPPHLLDLIDKARATYPVPVTRTWIIEYATDVFCSELISKQKGKTK